MASLEHRLEGNPEGTLGGISYILPLHLIVLFLIYFFYSIALLKQLQRLYIGSFIF